MAVSPFVTPTRPGSPSRSAGPGSISGTYVLDQFREFYEEVQILRDLALKSGRSGGFLEDAEEEEPNLQDELPQPPPLPGFAAPPPLRPQVEQEAAAESVPEPKPIGLTAEEAVRRLQTVLEMQALEAGQRGGEYGVLYYREAQYVMAALADEVFLTLDWPGREVWRNDLLETRLFGSYNAGEQVFKRLENLLRTGDRMQAEIAVVYLMALTLGFRGRYAGGKDEGRIAEYRKQLYTYIYQRRPDLTDPTHRLVSEPYQHTQGNVNARLLPSPSRWVWLFVAVCALYLVASHFVFQDALAPLIDALQPSGT